jgi:hypothetical protein
MESDGEVGMESDGEVGMEAEADVDGVTADHAIVSEDTVFDNKYVRNAAGYTSSLVLSVLLIGIVLGMITMCYILKNMPNFRRYMFDEQCEVQQEFRRFRRDTDISNFQANLFWNSEI